MRACLPTASGFTPFSATTTTRGSGSIPSSTCRATATTRFARPARCCHGWRARCGSSPSTAPISTAGSAPGSMSSCARRVRAGTSASCTTRSTHQAATRDTRAWSGGCWNPRSWNTGWTRCSRDTSTSTSGRGSSEVFSTSSPAPLVRCAAAMPARPASFVARSFDEDFHFMLVEIDRDELHFQAITRQGRTVDAGVLKKTDAQVRAAAPASP
jgi:hypothetical protein